MKIFASAGALVLALWSSTSCATVDPPASRPAEKSPPSESQAAQAGEEPVMVIPTAAPAPGVTVRVGGDTEAQIRSKDGEFFYKSLVIDTPLPEGYPDPTPPGSIDLKTYPAVRRAEYRGTGKSESGMDSAFWPLFNHIKSRDIAMTSPVEMDYHDVESSASPDTRDWTMSFLYRTTNQAPTGEDGTVIVRDAAPVTVLSMGVKGNYGMDKARPAMEKMEEWLAANPSWKAAGSWRSLYYNGPKLMWWNKWSEIQIPVVRVDGGESEPVKTAQETPVSGSPADATR